MIVSIERFTCEVRDVIWNQYLRVIRKHDHLGNTYYTDGYYQTILEKDDPLLPSSKIEPMFCIIRNLTEYERKVDHQWAGHQHPLRHTRIIVGSAYRFTKLFRKENQEEGRTFINNLPIECKEFTSVCINYGDLAKERKYLIPNVTDILSEDTSELAPYLKRSKQIELYDMDEMSLSALFEEPRGAFIKLNIWGILAAYVEAGWDGETAEEMLHSEIDTTPEWFLLNHLHYTDFITKCRRSAPNKDQIHPDDGIYLYTLQGRFIIWQYINHFHNDFQYGVIDVLERFLSVDRMLSRNREYLGKKAPPLGSGSDNLFEQLTELSLSDDILFR